MIEKKELPSEFVSIRQVWLQNINRCCEAISNRAKPDASDQAEFVEVGNRTVVYSVDTLYYSLVDYGEATVRTDLKKYYKEEYLKKLNKIWEAFEKKELEGSKCWNRSAVISIYFYDVIIQTLNKYGMLFQEQPQGYSNVVMEVLK